MSSRPMSKHMQNTKIIRGIQKLLKLPVLVPMLDAMQEELNTDRVRWQLSFKKQLNKNYFKMEKNYFSFKGLCLPITCWW